jgi:hypothetical protein
MDVSSNSVFETVSAVDEFSLVIAADRSIHFDTVTYKGLEIAAVEAQIIEAQFRFLDGSTLLLLNQTDEFKEKLTLLLVSAGLKELDRLLLGGAFTPGYLTYAYPIGPDEIAFCWHGLDQIVTVRRHRPRFAWRHRWLEVRELAVQPPQPMRPPKPRARQRWRMPRLRPRPPAAKRA